MTVLEALATNERVSDLAVRNLQAEGRFSAWDNRDTWDNIGGPFDNRPTWDNWNKK